MKRTYPQKNQPVQASEIDRDGSAEPSKQTNPSTGRVRSLATLGLAISVGASGILLPRNGDSARASELSPTAESTAEVQPISANGPASSGQIDGLSAQGPGVKVQQGQTLWEMSRDYEVEPKAPATANSITSETLLQVSKENPIGISTEATAQQNPGNTTATVNPEQKLNLTGSESLDSAAPSGQPTAATPLATPVPTQSSIEGPKADGAIDSLKKQENRTTASGRSLLESEGVANSPTPALRPESVPTPASGASTPQTSIPDLSATPVIPSAGAGQAASGDRVLESIEKSLATPSLPSAVVVAPAETNVAPAGALYSVRPGDTLDAIASRNGVSPKELIAANKLGNPNLLNINQRLKIPQLRSNNPAVQAAASDGASNSTSVSSAASVPASTSALSGASVAPSAPRVPVVSPLANLEGLNNISAPMVPKINSIPLTQVSQTISDNRKLELQGEPTFTGAVDTSALPMAASATATATDKGAYAQAVSYVSNPSPQALNADRATALPESNPEALNPYAERLRAEVVRLREEYRAERNSIGANAVSLAPSDAQETQVASGNPSQELPSVNPDLYTPEYAGAVQNEISRPPSAGWSQQVQKQQQERFDPARAAELQPINLTPTGAADRPVVATAPLGSDGYDPLSNPSLGRMVSPELPPLSGADTYLPNGSKQQSANGLIWPAKGVLTSGYGWRWGRMHKGIDIAGPIGTPIMAADSGVVTYAEWNDGGYGYLVEITHADGSETIYAHNSRILVQKGQRVERGEQISEMGSTGFSTGPHLHFEVHPAGQGAVNPMAFLPDDTSSASR
ncbi:peptidoglycan DD-metalloendopeptidase family protein [Microcoleus sp. bin38.metabat.b11b12b14.051]|uniref:peptidoglycan DD-metalloendopeptidase family protein n=1 Tax=Microcoleus sp. bin38.metabat.b11b12b14.051 TaxID=2742709 RepID=UPI0025FF0277|nr:peptidoglycan DD-metalloendopeptidase family protein [Microcoleus sp. bin38.metabat.b11b12b14.051]